MVDPHERATVTRQEAEQRFRGSLISSAALHTLALAVAVLGPALWPRTVIMPSVTPIRLVRLPSAPPPAPEPAAQEPDPQPAPEEPAPEPEPVPAVTSEPEPVPRSIRELQREREEAERLQQEAAEREARQREEEARRRAEEEARRRQQEEEERRRQPQKAARRPPAPQSQTARRTGIDVAGTEEAQTSFTVEDFPFAAYLMRIRDMVAERWSPPERGLYAPEFRAEVFFRIGRDGRLVVDPRVFASSDNTIYDQAAMRAIASAAPFPPLPRNYEGQSLGVRFAFVQE